MISDTVRILLPAAATFVIGMVLTPFLTHYLYTYKAWKKKPGKNGLDGSEATEFNRIHEVHETRAPRMGGIVVWGSVLITILGLAALAATFESPLTDSLNYLSRNQTWVPLATMLVGALVGFVDDLLTIRGDGKGLPLNLRLLLVGVLSCLIGIWFFSKLDVHTINIPFAAPIELGWLIVPFFIAMSLALYASGVIDGIDGLSGGVFMSAFAAYAIIAFAQHQIDLAAFTASIVGGLLAFLWFNIPPARFYMSDTGTMALTLTLAVVAFMTDSLGEGVGVAVLPIIGALLVVTVASNVIQVLSKKFLGKKIFRVAPLHHHFEAIGWPGYKVAMRYWVLSIVFAFLGVILALSAI
jgi:phospho-N-acetylmuramoyl-pentapeptide-transferase